MDRQANVWTVDKKTMKWLNRQTNVCTVGQKEFNMVERMDEQINGWKDGQKDIQMDGQTGKCLYS